MGNDNFMLTKSGKKLYSLVSGRMAPRWYGIKADMLLRVCLNDQRDLVAIESFVFVVNNDIFDQ